MGQRYAVTMFGAAAKRLQEAHGSRAAYERMAERGEMDEALGEFEVDFIGERDSFYLASVTADGWPFVQHRGGPKGFLRVLDGRTVAFADFAGNKQYVSVGNFETNDRVAIFLMDYVQRARLKIIGHAQVVKVGADAELEAKVKVEGYRAAVERVMVVRVAGFDWNCSQHITQRWSLGEMDAAK